jgi:hypothetical protein
MMWNFWGKAGLMPAVSGAWAWMLAPLMLWSLFWKGLALWRSARGNQRYWFIALLVINTLGLLEIVYLIAFAKDKLTLGKTKKRR